MRTIQEKYNAILEGKFSKSQFVKDAKRELSQFLSPYNGYEDTVSILKSKGVIYEAKKKEIPEYDLPGRKYSDEALRRGVDYELEGMGLMSQESILEKDFIKAEKKAIKNLDKDPNHYLHLLSGDSKKVDKHDKYVEVKKNNHVDTFNGMKKAELREEMDRDSKLIMMNQVIKDIRSKYPELSASDIREFLTMHFMDILAGADPMEEFENYLSVNPEILNIDEKKGRDLDGDGDIDSDDYLAAKDKAIKKASGKDVDEGIPLTGVGGKEGDKDPVNKGIPLTGVGGKEGDKDPVNIGPPRIKGKSPKPYQDRNKNTSEAIGGPDHQKLEDLGYSAGEKALMSIDGKIFNHPNFDSFVGGFMKGFKDHMEASQDYASHSVNEGRRRKMKGGKVVTENDYETGGYVESMGPRLDKALKALTTVWDEWKNGPATEPGMVPFAKKDLISYIDSQINEGEDIVEDNVEEDYKPSHRAYNVIDGKGNIVYKELPRHTAIEKASEREDYGFIATDSLAEDGIEEHKEIKEAFKAIISKVLQEEVITEAATGNLSKIASTYDDFEGMQAAINALENVVTDVESYYGKTKEKIQKVYDSFKDIKNTEGLAVGALIGPAIEAAFRKDLMPVTEKGFTKGLEMPKVNMLKPGDIAEEELDEKETVFKPVTEGKKYKYTKRQK